MFVGIWEKYISVVKNHLYTAIHLTAEEKRQLMECLADAYSEIGEKAEEIAWRARAKAEEESK